jgi:predicted ester cyclase
VRRSAFHQAFTGAFPDLYLEVENITSDSTGEWLAVGWTATGTHQGDTLGIPATGQKMSMSGLSLVRVRNGQFIAGYDAYDQEAMLAQLQPQAKAAGA